VKKPKKIKKGWMERVIKARLKVARHGVCIVHHGLGRTDLDTSIQPIEQNG
jgi:hypothetical protein